MLPLGTKAPMFRLPNIDGNTVSLGDLADKQALLMMFICNHCPYVLHIRQQLAQIGTDYGERVAIAAINANDVSKYPDDSPEKMAAEAAAAGYNFPYLYDATQEVAKAYRAACTPDFYLFDRDRRLVYRGQLDDSRPGNNKPVTGHDLRRAMDATLASRPVDDAQKPSIGCNIKWLPRNQPEYSG